MSALALKPKHQADPNRRSAGAPAANNDPLAYATAQAAAADRAQRQEALLEKVLRRTYSGLYDEASQWCR